MGANNKERGPFDRGGSKKKRERIKKQTNKRIPEENNKNMGGRDFFIKNNTFAKTPFCF